MAEVKNAKITAYSIMLKHKDNIFNSFKLDTKDEELDIYFDAFCRGFNYFCNNAKYAKLVLNPEVIKSFFVSDFFRKLKVTTVNPDLLENVCKDIQNDLLHI